MSGVSVHRYPSPLRYPGGKGKVANYLKLVWLKNDLVGSEYVEPYAGGASVALSLLFEEYASHVHINDLNERVHAFWKTVLEQPEAICEFIDTVPLTLTEWERQRELSRDPAVDTFTLACSTFYLNRTSRSGIIGGGVIGGRAQRGRWKLDARFHRADLTRRIRKIARFASRITVTRRDTADYLREVLPTIDSAFVYLDPPYYVKGEGLYENFYRHADHEVVADLVRQLKVPWIVSYDAVPEVERLYRFARRLRYDLAYSAAARQQGHEVMFFSSGLELPELESPAGISGATVGAERARVA